MMKKNRMYRERTITVQCKTCGELDEKLVEFADIEEDIFGADVLAFKCPKCKTIQKSHRRG
jgi:phage FluMu protein Com